MFELCKKPYLWLIRAVGVIVPRSLRADWRQEWEAELRSREMLLAEWDNLNWKTKFDLLRRSLGAFWDALLLQPRRLEDEMFQDLRFGLRLLRKNPGFTAVAVFTLALSIGANAAIFDVVNGVLLKPLPYKEPDRIVRVFESHPTRPTFPISPANFLDYRERNDVFDDFATFARADLDLSVNDRPERLTGMRVSHGFFRLLGFEPELGRSFLPDDEIKGNEHVAIISHVLWERLFGKDPGAIGSPVTLSGRSFTIVGVVAPELQHVGGDYHSLPHGGTVDVWWPLTMDPAVRTSHFLNAIGKIKPGITRDQAEARMNVIALQLEQQHPEDKD